jgi:hypothetical protein
MAQARHGPGCAIDGKSLASAPLIARSLRLA